MIWLYQKHNKIWDFEENDHFHHNSPPPPAGGVFKVYLKCALTNPSSTLVFWERTPFSKKCVGFWQSRNVNILVFENICIWLYFQALHHNKSATCKAAYSHATFSVWVHEQLFVNMCVFVCLCCCCSICISISMSTYQCSGQHQTQHSSQ